MFHLLLLLLSSKHCIEDIRVLMKEGVINLVVDDISKAYLTSNKCFVYSQ